MLRELNDKKNKKDKNAHTGNKNRERFFSKISGKNYTSESCATLAIDLRRQNNLVKIEKKHKNLSFFEKF